MCAPVRVSGHRGGLGGWVPSWLLDLGLLMVTSPLAGVLGISRCCWPPPHLGGAHVCPRDHPPVSGTTRPGVHLLGASSLWSSACRLLPAPTPIQGPGPQVVCQSLLEGRESPGLQASLSVSPEPPLAPSHCLSSRAGHSCRGRRRRGEVEGKQVLRAWGREPRSGEKSCRAGSCSWR